MMTREGVLRTEEVTLGQLARQAGYRCMAGHRLPVTGICDDSRTARRGDLFVAVPGSVTDGLRHAADAVRRGAVAVAAERDPRAGVPWMRVPCARRAAGRLADLVYRHPSCDLALVGVTGTNGKTTTAHLLAQLVPGPAGFIGTTGVHFPGERRVTENTTPGAVELRRHLADMRAAGCQACALEVSSHALVQHRVDGLRIAAAIYTNLSGDHLDYHGTMRDYAAAKARLFTLLEAGAPAIYNPADAACRAAAAGLAGAIPFEACGVRVERGGTRFRWRGREVRIPLVGRHNAENAAAALEAACALGADPDESVALLSRVAAARGRLEPVVREPYLVLVDYAHTDHALEQALRAVREMVFGAVIVVFGCGGDRDRTKRPRMGAVAARWADRVIITSDNPRSEDAAWIADEIVRGAGTGPVSVELDRRAAIGAALRAARPGDAVLIAGKGHETYQLVGSRTLAFDDVEVARELLGRNP